MDDKQFDINQSEKSLSLFDKLYNSWGHVYGMDKAFAKMQEELPDISLPKLTHYDALAQVARSVAKYDAAAVRYQDIAYPNAEAVIAQLRVEFEDSQAKQDATKFPIVSGVLSDIYDDTIMDVVYSGYLTMSSAIENTIRQIKIALDIPEDKKNVDPVFTQFGIDFQQLMNKERAMKYWHEVTSSRIFSINAIANRIKHEFALIRQDDVLLHYLPNLIPSQHIKIDKERFFYDLNYTRSYLFQLTVISQDIKFSYHLKEIAKTHSTENHAVTPSPEQNVMSVYQMLLDLDNILGEENKLPGLTTLAIYAQPV